MCTVYWCFNPWIMLWNSEQQHNCCYPPLFAFLLDVLLCYTCTHTHTHTHTRTHDTCYLDVFQADPNTHSWHDVITLHHDVYWVVAGNLRVGLHASVLMYDPKRMCICMFMSLCLCLCLCLCVGVFVCGCVCVCVWVWVCLCLGVFVFGCGCVYYPRVLSPTHSRCTCWLMSHRMVSCGCHFNSVAPE